MDDSGRGQAGEGWERRRPCCEKMSIAFLAQTWEVTPMHHAAENSPSPTTGSDSSQSITTYQKSVASHALGYKLPSLATQLGLYETADDRDDQEITSSASPDATDSKSPVKRTPRSARPCYSEEQKFFRSVVPTRQYETKFIDSCCSKFILTMPQIKVGA